MRPQWSIPITKNKDFKGISNRRYSRGVYAVHRNRLAPQIIQDLGPVTGIDEQRVVGKGWRAFQRVRKEVLLFDDGSWDFSENWRRAPRQKRDRMRRKIDVDNSGQGSRPTEFGKGESAIIEPIIKPSNTDNKTSGSPGEAHPQLSTSQTGSASRPIVSKAVCSFERRSSRDASNSDAQPVKGFEPMDTAIRKPDPGSSIAVGSISTVLSSVETSDVPSNGNDMSSVAIRRTEASNNDAEDHSFRDRNKRVNEPTPSAVFDARGGAGPNKGWLSKAKRAVLGKKQPYDSALEEYSDVDLSVKEGPESAGRGKSWTTRDAPKSDSPGSIDATKDSISKVWPTPAESAIPVNWTDIARDVQHGPDSQNEIRCRIEMWKNLRSHQADIETVFKQMQEQEGVRLGLGAGKRSDRLIVLDTIRERVLREKDEGLIDSAMATNLIAYIQKRIGSRRTLAPEDEQDWDLLEDGDMKALGSVNGRKQELLDVSWDGRKDKGRYLAPR